MQGGCALYGHSCYGGHGKRSEPQISNDENQFSANPFRNDPNKELRVNENIFFLYVQDFKK